MRQLAKCGPIPLPDTEAVERCTVVRALSAVDSLGASPEFLRARMHRWADIAKTRELDLLVLGWPEKKACFMLASRTPDDAPMMIDRETIIAAYRHTLCDPRALKLFVPLEHQLRGVPTE